MSLFSILETLLIGPLKLVFEIIFQATNNVVDNPAVSVIVLSLLMNLLVLPLYRRADAMQEQSRDTEARLQDGVAHIKKTFKGDERMMMLQTYYRQNNYKPTHVLKGSVSLLLEIPFFMAAYQFLSSLNILSGATLGPIADLGAPDGLLTLFGFQINLLPVIMTLVNIVSSALYLKGFPLKTKLQLYGMALFFLVFLYTSPSGLVFYWTLNNIFSLVKNVFYKLKNPKLGIAVLAAVCGLAMTIASFPLKNGTRPELSAYALGIGIALICPIITYILANVVLKPKATKREPKPLKTQPSRKLFLSGAAFLTFFIGLLIPSNFIAASPQEFVDITYFHHPLWFVVSSLALAAGTFLVWFTVFYWLANPRGKVIFERIIWLCCGGAVVNYMFFGTDLGIISNQLKYDNGLKFSDFEIFINLVVIAVIGGLMYLAVAKWQKITNTVLLVAAAAVFAMGGINMFTVSGSVGEISEQNSLGFPTFNLSKKGNNVVVILLDRAMGEYVPYIFNEVEGLEEQFDGFTYYSNTVSFGGHTNQAAPAVMGGYEYTPVEINKRDTESLKDKHNEALLVMPTLFSNNGWNVTLCDVPYANYSYISDMSIYDNLENTSTYHTEGVFGNADMKEAYIANNHRNFFCFSLMKSLPLFAQYGVYDSGNYNRSASDSYSSYKVLSLTESRGYKTNFMEPFEVIRGLGTMGKITDDESDNFFFLYNDCTHEPMMMQEPEFVPAEKVDNTAYQAANPNRFTLGDKKIIVDTEQKLIHYQTNAAVLVQLGQWFDYLRENGVYDNTKIILVSDHGFYWDDGSYQTEALVAPNGRNMANYFPLFMVKEFNAKHEGLKTDSKFMTNADVPTIAFKGTIKGAVNPFTGKKIGEKESNREKTEHDQFIMLSRDWNIDNHKGNCFNSSQWAAVGNNIWDNMDWQFIYQSTALKEHEMPDG